MLHHRKYFQDGLLKAAVFGANDGIITTFAVVTAVSGASLPSQVILILGIANMVADGISMGLGDFLGERSERKYQQIQNNPQRHLSHIGLTSLITFIAFVSAGILPLLPYLLAAIFNFPVMKPLLYSTISTIIALFFVGSLRTSFIKGTWWRNGLEMLLLGALAASASYFIGKFVGTFVSSPL